MERRLPFLRDLKHVFRKCAAVSENNMSKPSTYSASRESLTLFSRDAL
jgi:hypothetical protein